ncbi:MAG: hypothetical protein HXY34_09705 [Candidatus Thorarchaeota archaeon]|nr:hypothetical protein [Candidatus Thorarchaeota archaeon]
MPAPCYVCGAESIVEGLCPRCYRESHPLVHIDSPLSMQVCRRCGAVALPGGWKPILEHYVNATELLDLQIALFISHEASLLNADVDLYHEIERQLDRVVDLSVVAHGKSHNELEAHEERIPVQIRISPATCDTCGLMSGGYHNAVLQIRAQGRHLSEDEVERISDIVTQMTHDAYGRDVKAFVTSVERHKYGLDFKIGSEHLARRISDEIESTFLAERKENYKLISQEPGSKGKYRVTIVLRLPRFVAGDFLMVGGHPCQAKAIAHGNLSCYDLVDGTTFAVNPRSSKWSSVEFICSEERKRRYTAVADCQGQSVLFMDLTSFATVEVDSKRLNVPVRVGDTVSALLLDDTLYVIELDETPAQ